jgi:hypothetical protein
MYLSFFSLCTTKPTEQLHSSLVNTWQDVEDPSNETPAEDPSKNTLVTCHNPSRPLLDEELCPSSYMGATLVYYRHYLVVSTQLILGLSSTDTTTVLYAIYDSLLT